MTILKVHEPLFQETLSQRGVKVYVAGPKGTMRVSSLLKFKWHFSIQQQECMNAYIYRVLFSS